MPLLTWESPGSTALVFLRKNGKIMRKNGKLVLATSAAMAAAMCECCECSCASACCCDDLGDLYAEASVGTCYDTLQMTREADGTYAGSVVRLWKVELSLGASTLTIYVQCWSGDCAVRFFADACGGVPPTFDPYNPTDPAYENTTDCGMPLIRQRPGSCNDAECGTPPMMLDFSINTSPFT